MGKKTGRKPKYTQEEKISVINRYFIEVSDPDVLQTHGIYAKLSAYAKSLGIELEAYDFSKDKPVRAYIEEKTAGMAIENSALTVPTYQPLDITVLLTSGRKIIEDTLVSREHYFESLHKKAAVAIENYLLLAQRCDRLQKETADLKRQCEQLAEEKEALNKRLISERKDLAYLKKIIRKDVEPERAQCFFEGLTSQEAIVEAVQDSVLQKMDVLTQDDRKLHFETENDMDVSDLSALFIR